MIHHETPYSNWKAEIHNDIEHQNLTRDRSQSDIAQNFYTKEVFESSAKKKDNITRTRLGNCNVFIFKISKWSPRIVIGPHWYFYIIGCMLFIGFDVFLLVTFWSKLSNLLATSNIMILITEVFLYTLVFLSDPGIKVYPKAKFSDDSETVCDSCYSTIEEKTYHCDWCNVCISELDHHCVWIGKCVGKDNYKLFYAFVCFTPAYFIVIFFITGVLNFTNK